MSFSIYAASIPVMARALDVMSDLLRKAEAHAADQGLDPAELTGARLAPDMLDLVGQVQRASDTSKFTGQRMSGIAAPSFPDTETTFDELQARIAGTLAYLRGIDPSALDSAEDRPVELKLGLASRTFSGADYLLQFALPNLFFHVATAHDILRHKGVRIGKLDYLGRFD
jgi:uncharacterized protein